jgi:hypothetical protein
MAGEAHGLGADHDQRRHELPRLNTSAKPDEMVALAAATAADTPTVPRLSSGVRDAGPILFCRPTSGAKPMLTSKHRDVSGVGRYFQFARSSKLRMNSASLPAA